jgi:beta-N-acetylhexosaminidase
MTKKLYQLIIPRLDGEAVNSESYKKKIFELVERGIGGFILFGGKKDNIKKFIDSIQSYSEIPLFIASDIEYGVGQQIENCTVFPCQMAVSAAIKKNSTDDISILENAVKALADEAKDIGINMPLIPVLDVNQNPDNPIICTRAFSGNPEDVSWFGSKYIEILESAGLISCAKHFPGHGDTSVDSHKSLPVIKKSYEELMEIDILPFRDTVKAGSGSIMIGHLRIPAVDDKPATLSRKIITTLLREELGFDGLVITDALNMSALKNFKHIPSRCIKAGADILLHPVDPDMTVKELINAIELKEISEEQIDETLSRIFEAKAKIRKIKRLKVDYNRHKDLSLKITDMSISVLKKAKGVLPLKNKEKVCVIFAGDNRLFSFSPFRNRFRNIYTIDRHISPLQRGVKGGLTEDKAEKLSKITIFCIFTSVTAWRGSSGIDQNIREKISELIKKARQSVVISFGSPYVLRHFKAADILIAAYEATAQAQSAVIKCLEGLLEFKGRIPVNVSL